MEAAVVVVDMNLLLSSEDAVRGVEGKSKALLLAVALTPVEEVDNSLLLDADEICLNDWLCRVLLARRLV